MASLIPTNLTSLYRTFSMVPMCPDREVPVYRKRLSDPKVMTSEKNKVCLEVPYTLPHISIIQNSIDNKSSNSTPPITVYNHMLQMYMNKINVP